MLTHAFGGGASQRPPTMVVCPRDRGPTWRAVRTSHPGGHSRTCAATRRKGDDELTNSPHHVGILGHSPEGAALCWSQVCRHSTALGHTAHPDLTMDCISFQHAMPAWDAGDYSRVRALLFVSADRLAKAGAQFFVCPDNTAHLALEQPGPELPLPGVHLVEAVADKARKNGYRRVAILGTRFTMTGPLYPRELGRFEIDAVVPDEKDRAMVDALIFDDLVHGRVTPEARRSFRDLAQRMRRDKGCDAVAAVCTEIPLVLTDDTSPLPVLDSTRLLAASAAEVAHGLSCLPTWSGGPLR